MRIDKRIELLNLDLIDCNINLIEDNDNEQLIKSIITFLKKHRKDILDDNVKNDKNDIMQLFELILSTNNKNSENFFNENRAIKKEIDVDNIDEIVNNKQDHNLITLIAWFYYYKNNQVKCLECFNIGVQKNDTTSMLNLANYYYYYLNDVEESTKYYLMAANNGNVYAMINLANYYRSYELNDHKAIKYYIMAIEKGNEFAMQNLIELYDEKSMTSSIKDIIKKHPHLATRDTICELSKTLQINCLKSINRNRDQEDYYKELCRK